MNILLKSCCDIFSFYYKALMKLLDVHVDISYSSMRSMCSDEKPPSNLGKRKSLRFTIKLQIHITQNALHAFTARRVSHALRRENINTLDVSATSIAYDTNISN